MSVPAESLLGVGVDAGSSSSCFNSVSNFLLELQPRLALSEEGFEHFFIKGKLRTFAERPVDLVFVLLERHIDL